MPADEPPSSTSSADVELEIAGGVKVQLGDLMDSGESRSDFADAMREPPHPSQVLLQPVRRKG